MANVFTARILKNTEIESTFTGNGATEDTLHQLLELLQKSRLFKKTEESKNQEQRKVSEEADKAAKKFYDSQSQRGSAFDTLKSMGGNFFKNTIAGIAGSADRVRLFGGMISDVTISLTRLNTDIGSLSSTINSLGGGTSNFVTSLGSMMGRGTHMFSQVIGNMIRVGASVSGFAIDQAATFSRINQNLFKSSLAIGDGMTDFAELAFQAQIPLEQFSQYLINANSSLRFFEGGAVRGAQQISEAISVMREGNAEMYEHLFRIGYTTEDIIGSMADYAARANLLGESLDPQQLAEGTRNYMINLRELSRLTGVSVDEARKQAEQMRTNLFMQRAMEQIPEEFQGGVRDFIENLPSEFEDIGHYLVSGQVHSREAGLLLQSFPGIIETMREHVLGLSDGTLDASESAKNFAEILEEGGPEFKGELSRAANIWGTTIAANLPEAELLGKFSGATRQLIENASSFGEGVDSSAEAANDVAELLGRLPVALEESVSRLERFLTENLLLDHAGSMVRMINTSGELADRVSTKAQDWIDNFEMPDDLNFNLPDILRGSVSIAGQLPKSMTMAIAGSIYGIRGIVAGAVVGHMIDNGFESTVNGIVDGISEITGISPLMTSMILGAAGASRLGLPLPGILAGAAAGALYHRSRIDEELQKLNRESEIGPSAGLSNAEEIFKDRSKLPALRREIARLLRQEGLDSTEILERLEQDFGDTGLDIQKHFDEIEERINRQSNLNPSLRQDQQSLRLSSILDDFENNNISVSALMDPELKRLTENTNTELKKVGQRLDQAVAELKTIKSTTVQGTRQAENYYTSVG